MKISTAALAFAILVALAGLHTAWSGAVVFVPCDDRKVMAPPVCNVVTDPTQCAQAYSPNNLTPCEWTGISCVEVSGQSCTADVLDGINCGTNVVGSCNLETTFEGCAAARSSEFACVWNPSAEECQPFQVPCNE